ncbi:MAG: hypothetical protein N4A49_11705 [Marinifilaceae bacterium]|jgi:cation:H+ antiporter|nr:hypothetical protein [Marinifilaceae bacterium]
MINLHFLFQTWYGGLFLMIICSYIIAKTCNVFESATDYLGRNMSEGVKGASLNAIGSSMPELLTTVFFLAFASYDNLGRDLAASIGGNTGSAIFNSIVIPMLVIWVVIATVAGVKSISIAKKVILRDGLFLIAGEIILLVLLSSSRITHWHGWVFTLFYLVYLAYTFITMPKSDRLVEEHKHPQVFESWYEKYQFKSEKNIISRSWILLLGSTTIMAIACAGLVEGCKGISHDLSINPLFVALVVVAAASSVPDTIISIKDAKKGNYDDSLSNVLGSNIFDITISLGLPLAVFLLFTGHEIEFSEAGETLIDIRIMLILITILTIIVFYFSKKMGIKQVLILACLYIIFIIYSVGAASFEAGNDDFLARIAGVIIEYLKPFNSLLQNIADSITRSW